ncbi:MAG: twin-arginine translocase TatA/TatE family subunit [Candidatus Rokubacteria bacterium]|nr:twin-arginine translocase TatA/TatE family subunit [Candidatus Rokubacteria bacterium]
MIGNQDLILGAIIVIVLFGAKKLPELAGALGKSMKEFKKGATEGAADNASRTCASCQTPLEAEWSHCPCCGASTPVTAISKT